MPAKNYIIVVSMWVMLVYLKFKSVEASRESVKMIDLL